MKTTQALLFGGAFPYAHALPALPVRIVPQAGTQTLFEGLFGMQRIRVGESHEMGELLQIRFPRHADAAGDEIVPLSPKVQFRKEFRVLVILAIGQHTLDNLVFPFSFGIVQMFFIQLFEYLFAGR